jgi:hypothetical protein
MTDAEIARYFRPPLTEPERDALRGLLARVAAALDPDYLVYAGALLGYCLFRDLLPWDDDADLLVLHWDDGMADRLRGRLPGLGVLEQWPGLVKVYRPGRPRVPDRPWTYPFVDVLRADLDAGWVTHASAWGGVDRFPAADVLPLKTGLLGGVEVRLPADPEAVCRTKFGPDCLAAGLPPHFDHTRERRTGFPAVRVPIPDILRVYESEADDPPAGWGGG